jgi:hypothetical protein
VTDAVNYIVCFVFGMMTGGAAVIAMVIAIHSKKAPKGRSAP